MSGREFDKTRIGDIARVKGGKRLPKAHSFLTERTSHPYIRGQDIRGGRINISRPVFISEDTFSRISRYTVDAGDVCVTIVGNIGDVAMVPKSLAGANLTENAAKLTELDSEFDSTFVMYALLSPDIQLQMKNLAAGAAQPKLGFYKLEAVEVPTASLSIQRKIAAILSAYDDLIENNTRRIALLEEMAQAIYREWFVHFRYPGHEQTPLTNSPIGPIPEGWEVKSLRDLCESNSYGFTASASPDEIGPKFLRITDIVPSTISWDDVPYCEIEETKVGKYLLRKGDVVVARTGATTGFAKRLNKRHPKSVFASYLVRLRPLPEVGTAFVGILVESDDYKRFIKANLSGAAQPQANAQVLTSLTLAVPSEGLLHQFDERVESLLDQKEILDERNRNLRSTRDLLLPKLISGKLDVADLYIDTVETLEQNGYEESFIEELEGR